jgi:hypothetical protein
VSGESPPVRHFDFPVGVHDLHDDVSLDFQLNRLATLGGGQLEEVRAVAPRIKDLADWKREFLSLAERAVAGERPQHAAAYLRAAEFFMAATDPDKAEAYDRQALAGVRRHPVRGPGPGSGDPPAGDPVHHSVGAAGGRGAGPLRAR